MKKIDDQIQQQNTSQRGDPTISALKSPVRRRLTTAGLGAPILMTLVSKPALAGNCLSNMMSGNLSDPNRGECQSGWSPGGWGNPGGKVGSYSTLEAWRVIGYHYGDGNGGNPNGYNGGTLFKDGPFVVPVGWENITMREVVRYENDSIERTYLVAWLNAQLSQVDPFFTYVLTPDQVLGLISGAIDLPPGPWGGDLKSFFHSTWD